MITRKFLFECILFAALWIGVATAQAHERTDSTSCEISNPTEQTYTEEHKQNVEEYRRKWNRLMPHYMKFQFAGGMGLGSLGVGWEYGRDHWETDVLFGFLPKFSTRHNKITFTLKQNYFPWRISVGNHWQVSPFACGIYLNSVLSNEFWVNEPERYPEGYYGFSSKVRIHIYIGQRATVQMRNSLMKRWNKLSFFYEVSTCDLHLVSAFNNRYLKLNDILSLSLGVKLQML